MKKQLYLFNRDEKLKLIKFAYKNRGLLVKWSIDKVAEKLKIFRYTVFDYLEEVKR